MSRVARWWPESFSGHCGTCNFQWKVTKDYEDQHGGCSSGVRSKEIERIREFWVVVNMELKSTLFKKRERHIVVQRCC